MTGPLEYHEPTQYLIGCDCWTGWFQTKSEAVAAWGARLLDLERGVGALAVADRLARRMGGRFVPFERSYALPQQRHGDALPPSDQGQAVETGEEMAVTSFQREERFIVIKRKHLTPFMEESIRNLLAALEVSTVECVVVESDWPEYETVWKMIEARVAGATPDRECISSPDGRHQVDTSMESGPSNCFHCGQPMRRGDL